MNKFAIFRQSSVGIQFFLLLFLIVFLTLISLLLIAGVTSLFFDLPLNSMNQIPAESLDIDLSRTIQLISQIGVFVLPPILLAFLVSERFDDYLGLNVPPKSLYVITGILLMFTILPFIHFMADWNADLHLPEFMSGIEQWMHEKEEQAEIMSLQFLEVESFRGLLFNLFLIGMMPAIGEELLFRSVVQPLAGKVFRNIHIGILVSAVLFSGMHMQFFGFFPRLMLGVLLGYFYYWSGSIWVPMMLHFINNGTAVLVYYLSHNQYIIVDPERFGASENVVWVILSMLTSGIILFYVWRKRRFIQQTLAN